MSQHNKFRTLVPSLLTCRSGLASLAFLSGLLVDSSALAQAPAAHPRGVGVADVVVKGALGKELVRSTILPHLGEVRRCVDSGLGAELQLGGLVTVNFKIAASGAIRSARIKPSPLRDPQIEKCILTLLKSWAFPKLSAGVTKVTYPFELFATTDEVYWPAGPGPVKSPVAPEAASLPKGTAE